MSDPKVTESDFAGAIPGESGGKEVTIDRGGKEAKGRAYGDPDDPNVRPKPMRKRPRRRLSSGRRKRRKATKKSEILRDLHRSEVVA